MRCNWSLVTRSHKNQEPAKVKTVPIQRAAIQYQPSDRFLEEH